MASNPPPAEPPPPAKQVLLVCSHFWPSVGGIETSLGQLGGALVAAGYGVTVLTLAFPGRSADSHQGVRIRSVDQPGFPAAIRAAVACGQYDACILIQDPLGAIVWSVEGLQPPPRTRLLIQPVINEDGYARWRDNADFSRRLAAILQRADVPLVMTLGGPDTRYMRGAGIDPVYLPNASEPAPPAGDFRLRHGIAPDRFLVLHVANLYAVKNHIGLIDALPDLPPSWQLVLVGNVPRGSAYAAAVQARLAERPEILFVPGLPPGWVSAAMDAADVLVLASHGEGSPITILEAMSHRKPWLATPHCGAANDHLGGIVTELAQFKSWLVALQRNPGLRAALGEVGHGHWQVCYAWPVVIQGWIELIEHGRLQRRFHPRPDLVERMQALRLQLDAERAGDAAAARAAPLATTAAPADAPLVSVIVLADRAAQGLQRQLRSIAAQSHGAVEVLVVHAGTAALETAARQVPLPGLTFLALAPGTTAARARNAGLALARGEYVAFLAPGDEFLPRHLETLVGALRASPHRIACAQAELVTPAADGGVTVRLHPWAAIEYSRPLLAVGNFVPPSCALVQRALHVEAGPYDEALQALEDWDWLLRASAHSGVLQVRSVSVRMHGAAAADAATAPAPDLRHCHEQVYARHPAPGPDFAALRAQHLARQYPEPPAALAAGPATALPAQAEAACAAARQGRLELPALFSAAEQLAQQQRFDLAIDLYRLWLRHTASPLAHAAGFNLGVMLERAGRHAEAAQAYRQALGRVPDFAQARFRLAAVLHRQGALAEARAHWRWLGAQDGAGEMAAESRRLADACELLTDDTGSSRYACAPDGRRIAARHERRRPTARRGGARRRGSARRLGA